KGEYSSLAKSAYTWHNPCIIVFPHILTVIGILIVTGIWTVAVVLIVVGSLITNFILNVTCTLITARAYNITTILVVTGVSIVFGFDFRVCSRLGWKCFWDSGTPGILLFTQGSGICGRNHLDGRCIVLCW